jgi:predicted GNAT family N-acyltransferase
MKEIRQIEYLSKEYLESVSLREKILRKPLGMHFSEEFIKKDSEDYHFALFFDDKLAAILLMKPLSSYVVKMRQVAVESVYQNKNLGTDLVLFSEKFAIEKNFSRIVLHARATAVNFYLRLNYKIISDEFIEIGIPHFKMEKILTIS